MSLNLSVRYGCLQKSFCKLFFYKLFPFVFSNQRTELNSRGQIYFQNLKALNSYQQASVINGCIEVSRYCQGNKDADSNKVAHFGLKSAMVP